MRSRWETHARPHDERHEVAPVGGPQRRPDPGEWVDVDDRRSRPREREQWIDERDRDQRLVSAEVVIAFSIVLGALIWVLGIYFAFVS